MPTESEDERWAARHLSAEAEQCHFDRAAFRARVMSEVHVSLDSEGAPTTAASRRRLLPRPQFPRARVTHGTSRAAWSDPRPRSVPAILAAAAIMAITVVAAAVPNLHLWGGQDRLGDPRAAGNAPGSGAPPPTQTSRLGANPPNLSSPAPTPAATSPQTGAGTRATLPSTFSWSSSQPLIGAKPDPSHSVTGVKDASVVYHNGRWHVFATATDGAALTLVYLNFTDWSDAGSATQHFLDRSRIGGGYRAAPQVFYFAPQKLWYLVYQTGNASYSTNPDISDPTGWSTPKDFYSGMPDLIGRSIGNGNWVDMWVICDDANCYLFSSDQQGNLYRSQTALASFPNAMSQPVVALHDSNRLNLLNSASVYKVSGTGRYLLIVEAIGSDGVGYLRSWTASSPGGAWSPLAATESNPFARSTTVTFGGGAWTRGISHGELIRDGYDQTLNIDPCHLRYLYHGQSYQLGLLTQANSSCS